MQKSAAFPYTNNDQYKKNLIKFHLQQLQKQYNI